MFPVTKANKFMDRFTLPWTLMMCFFPFGVTQSVLHRIPLCTVIEFMKGTASKKEKSMLKKNALSLLVIYEVKID